MKYGLILSAILVSVATGCSKHDGTTLPIEKLPVVATINPGELVAGVPADISGKTITAYKTASVDVVNDKEMSKDLRWYLKQGDTAVIAGWTFVNPEADAAGKVYIELASADARYYAIIGSRLTRPDVAKQFDLANNQVGYQLTIKTGGMAPGAYRISVLQLSDGGVLRWESPARIILDEI